MRNCKVWNDSKGKDVLLNIILSVFIRITKVCCLARLFLSSISSWMKYDFKKQRIPFFQRLTSYHKT